MDILESLLQKRTKRPSKISAPEIAPNAVLYCALLNADERDKLEYQFAAYREAMSPGSESFVGFRKFVFAFCLCDEANTRLLDSGDDEMPAADFIEKMDRLAENVPLPVIARMFEMACKTASLTKQDVEDLTKNSEATAAGDEKSSKQQPSDSGENSGSKASKAQKKKRNTKR